jgi:hypothetical protein
MCLQCELEGLLSRLPSSLRSRWRSVLQGGPFMLAVPARSSSAIAECNPVTRLQE